MLNKQTNIPPEAREKVSRAIEGLQYQPNKLVCVLTSLGFDATTVISTRSTKTMAGNPFFSEVLHTITTEVGEEGFDMILQMSRNLAEDLHKCESKIKQKMIKGIIMLGSSTDELFFVQLDKYDISVMIVGKAEGQYNHVYSVDTDNYGDSVVLTDALIESGRRNITYLYASFDVHVSVDRVDGYKQSLAMHNTAICDEWIVDGGYTHETALKVARELLSQSSLPKAVSATDNLKLMSIYRATVEKNITIPQQLAVVGCNNETLPFILVSAPSGIDVPAQELGR